MQTLLTYTVTSNPQPLQASPVSGSPLTAQFSLIATNNSSVPVNINWLELSIPIGTAADDLTSATNGFGTNIPAGWQLGSPSQSGGLYTFVFTAPTGVATVQPGQDIIFTVNNIPLVTQPGSPVLTVTEGSTGNPTQNYSLTLYPNGFGTISFIASPANINSGGNAVLSWLGPSGATYTLQYILNDAIINVPAQGAPALGSSGSYPGEGDPVLTLSQTTVFTLTVTQVINKVIFTLMQQATVTVIAATPLIASFTGSMSGPVNNQVLNLSWTTQNADSVYGSWTTEALNPNPVLPQQISPPFLPSYQITATNNNQSVESNPIDLVLGVINTINLTMPNNAPAAAYGVVLSPDGNTAYVSDNYVGGGSLWAINMSDFSVNQNLITTGSIPSLMAITSDGNFLFVANAGSNSVSAIQLNSPGQTSTSIPVGHDPHGIAITPDNAYVLVTNSVNDSVSLINIETLTVTQTIQLTPGSFPIGIAITQINNQTTALVANNGLCTLSVITIANGSMTLSNTVINFADAPTGIAVSPDNNYSYIVNTNDIETAGNLVIIELATLSITQTISLAGGASAVAITPDGASALVTNLNNNSLTVIDLNNSSASPLNVKLVANAGPSAVAVSPNGACVLVVNAWVNTLSLLAYTPTIL